MASTNADLLLQRHLRRAQNQATAFAAKVTLLQTEYIPPFRADVGWDTGFQPRRDKQAYVPIPMVWYTVNVMASLTGMRPPVFSMLPKTSDTSDREQAAKTELLVKFEQQRQELDLTHLDLAKTLSIKGRAGVKVGYGPGDELWTENIDAIENLWAEFENDTYKKVRTWSYHSFLDKDVAREDYGWKGNMGGGVFEGVRKAFQVATAANPLGRSSMNPASSIPPFDGVPMVDFHYADRDAKGNIKTVRNAIFIGGELISDEDTKMNEFPYITINCENEPGNPFGIGDAEPVVGLQKEVATRVTSWAEAIRRNGQDQWKVFNLRGLTTKELDGGGRFFMLGDKDSQDIEPLKFPIDDLGFQAYIAEVKESYREITGIPPEVLGGGHVSAGTSGFAMAVKFQSVVTRLGPRQARLKSFYRDWTRKTLKNMEIVSPKAKAIIDGNYFTEVDFDPMTPKDFAQQVTSLATAVQARIMSNRTAMEQLNLVSEDEETYIKEWNKTPELSPQSAAAVMAVEGQQTQQLAGNPQTAAGVAAAQANAARPSMAGENQHTMPAPPPAPPQPTAHDQGSQLVGAAVSSQSPISVSPPTR